VGEQAKTEHRDDRHRRAVHAGEPQQSQTLAQHQGEQEPRARFQAAPMRQPVGSHAADGTREQCQQPEAAGRHAGAAQVQSEVVHVIDRGHAVHKQFDAEATGIGHEQHPHPVVARRRQEHRPATAFAAVDGDAACAQLGIVALWAILRVLPVQHADDQHQHSGHEHRRAPAEAVFHAHGQHRHQNPGHHRLGDAGASVAPARRDRVGGAHHVGREHHRGVVLGDHEAGTDGTDRQAKEQEGVITLREGDPEHRDRAQQQQARVGAARTKAVAQRPHQQAYQDCDRHRGDVDIRSSDEMHASAGYPD
jgi:hypothetical protein